MLWARTTLVSNYDRSGLPAVEYSHFSLFIYLWSVHHLLTPSPPLLPAPATPPGVLARAAVAQHTPGSPHHSLQPLASAPADTEGTKGRNWTEILSFFCHVGEEKKKIS